MSDKKLPTHRIYFARQRDKGQDDQLTAVGAVWPHNKGDGFGVTIDVPLNIAAGDRLVLLPIKDREAA